MTVNVSQGAATASYPLTAGLVGGSYTIKAVYNGTVNFADLLLLAQRYGTTLAAAAAREPVMAVTPNAYILK